MYTVSGPDEDAEAGLTERGVVGGTKLFNRFTLQKVLGRGGMGIVWLARDERLDRLVALKLVPEAVCFDASAQEDLKRETRKSLLLTHPNIVRIFDFIEDEHSAAISMEYVDGATLSSLRVKKPSKCFEVEEIGPWICSLCDALSYAHESAHLVHRDLKPANLMVNSRDELKITDFGIACTLRDSMSRVSVRASSGTLNYMSPQQMLGGDPSASDDIYAVGATLYEMLSSRPPFYGGDIASQVKEVIAPTVTQRRAKFGINGAPIPKYWEETIARCLAKQPEDRPQSPADIARRLRLGGTARLADVVPDRKLQFTQTLGYLRAKANVVDPRISALAGGVMALIAAIIFASHTSNPSASNGPSVVTAPSVATTPTAITALVPARIRTAAAPQKKAAVSTPPVLGYAMEAPATKAPSPLPEAESTFEPITVVEEPAPDSAPEPSAKNAMLQLTTSPAGATFAVYPGVIAGKSAPATAPLCTGSAPDAIADLPPGRYTLFFHNNGWPDDRAEISVAGGENVPVHYTFPHGSVTISSTPDGAEIFFAAHSLGRTPLTVDLPLGKQKLSARISDFPERSQSVTIENGKTANIAFQMRVRSRSVAKATPTPSALDKIGQSFKNIFGHKDSPTRKGREPR